MAFNRLHLAAALLEYDNDNDQPSSAPRNAKDSIMFKALRAPRAPVQVQPPAPRDDPRKSWVTQREPTRADAQGSSSEDDYDEEQDGQVNLASWGLPQEFIASTSPRSASSSVKLAQRPASAMQAMTRTEAPATRRPHSVHLETVADDAIEEIRALSPGLRATIDNLPSSTPTLRGLPGPRIQTQSHDAYSSVLAEAERVRRLAEGHSPPVRGQRTTSDAALHRPRTMFEQQDERLDRPGPSRRLSSASQIPFPTSPPAARRAATSLSQYAAADVEEDAATNPFALPPPPASLVSRFDPKAAAAARPASRQRHASQGSMTSRLSVGSRAMMERVGESSRAVVLDKNGRPVSTYLPASPKRATLLDKHGNPVDEPASPPARSRSGVLYDRKSLLFPKVLVMPSPLQASLPVDNSEATFRDGFKVGEKPLPPGARPMSLFPTLPSSNSVHRLSSIPRNLTLSQQTFRSSLLVGGQREEAFIGGAIQDGDVGWEREDDDDYDDDDPRKGAGKPVGALYGTSLMDQLEARKKALKSKQRVFAGDARPSMMARQSSDRQSTLIDPASLNLPEAEKTAQRRPSGRQRLPHSKSVFGVDEVWEKEVAKLKIIEERERAAEEAEEEKERARAAKKDKRGKKSRKGKERAVDQDEDGEQFADAAPDISPVRRMPELPPTLQYSPEKATMAIDRGDEDGDSKERTKTASRIGVDQWVASSDEESDGGRRSRRRATKKPAAVARDESESSEDEVPLSQQFKIPPRPQVRAEDDLESSDEDVPLSKLVPNARQPTHAAQSDDDDVPLGLNHTAPRRDEDDLPLGMQHASAAQQQYMQQMQMQMAMQQQHQMLMQQQQQEMFMRQSMFMPNAGMPFPSFDPYAMMAPPQPQVQAAGIDRWRREVPLPSASASSAGGR